MDREKVIKEFELFVKEFHPACTSEGVELDMFREVLALLKEQEHKDRVFQALEDDWKRLKELLKEQEPVAPVLVGRMWECGKCHAPVGIFMDDKRDQFCRTCGRSVKWE